MVSFVACKLVKQYIYHFGSWLASYSRAKRLLAINLRLIFKALYSDNGPSYLNLQDVKPIRHLHSNVAPRLSAFSSHDFQ